MKFSVLGSGSSGNSTYIENDDTKILIDAGLSAKQIEQRLISLDLSINSINGILITHEHIDHVKGIGVLSKRYKIPIYINKKTWDNLPKSLPNLPDESFIFFDETTIIYIKNLQIKPIPISHDAANPFGFIVSDVNNTSLAVITDLGYLSERIVSYLDTIDTLILEANYDVNMLLMGTYPWNIKRRILGDTGHLSNLDTALALKDILTKRTNTLPVYLAHMSKENNLSEIAISTIDQILKKAGFIANKHYKLNLTYQDMPTKLTNVKQKELLTTS